MSRLRCALGVAVVVTLIPAHALAQQYPGASESRCIILLDEAGNVETSPFPGQGVVAESDSEPGRFCFDPRSIAQISFIQSEVRLASVRVDNTGNYSTRGMGVTIPEGARPGSASIRASGRLNDAPVAYTLAITIEGAAAGPRLPVTGTQIALLALWAVGLLVFGSVLISATWRRYREAKLEASFAQQSTGLSLLDDPDDVRPYRPVSPTTWVDAEPEADDTGEIPVVGPAAYLSTPDEPELDLPAPDESALHVRAADEVALRLPTLDELARDASIDVAELEGSQASEALVDVPAVDEAEPEHEAPSPETDEHAPAEYPQEDPARPSENASDAIARLRKELAAWQKAR